MRQKVTKEDIEEVEKKIEQEKQELLCEKKQLEKKQHNCGHTEYYLEIKERGLKSGIHTYKICCDCEKVEEIDEDVYWKLKKKFVSPLARTTSLAPCQWEL